MILNEKIMWDIMVLCNLPYTCMYVYTCVTDTYLFILKYTPALCFYLALYDLYIRYNVAC